jgi:hypothetical protein
MDHPTVAAASLSIMPLSNVPKGRVRACPAEAAFEATDQCTAVCMACMGQSWSCCEPTTCALHMLQLRYADVVQQGALCQ